MISAPVRKPPNLDGQCRTRTQTNRICTATGPPSRRGLREQAGGSRSQLPLRSVTAIQARFGVSVTGADGISGA